MRRYRKQKPNLGIAHEVKEHFSLVKMNIAELAKVSEGVILGEVQRIHSTRAMDPVTENDIVYTDNVIKVLDRYLGPEFGFAEVKVRTLGGVADEMSMSVPESPHFVPRERAIVFLSKDTGNRFELERDTFTVMGWYQGKLSVVNDLVVIPGQAEPVKLEDVVSELRYGFPKRR